MQIETAELPDRPVRYLEAGRGRAIVFLHAFPLHAEQWQPQLARVPPGWRAIAPDLHGFGPSPAATVAGAERTGVGAHAADVLALMTRLGIDRAVIAGLSMGGYIALALMRAAPHRAAGLVLANTRATADSEEGRASRDRMIALAERDGAAGVAREMIPKLLGPSSRAAQPRLEHTVRRLIEANTSAGITAALRAMKARPDSSALLPSIACPTLILSGNEDALVPEPDVQAMAMSIPGASRQVMAGAGHLTNLEAPDAFNDALAAFLAGPAGGAARA